MIGGRQKSIIKNFEHKIFDAYNQLEQATLEFSHLEEILKEVCQEIQSALHFEFISISLIDPEKNTIEAIYGTGIAQNWSGRAGHYIEEDPALRDIQADIVKNCKTVCRTEIIFEWDDRFDRGIYEEQNHHELVRVYVPIALVRDENGKIREDNWFDNWRPVAEEKEKSDGQHTIIDIHLPNISPEAIEVIGTVEAGFNRKNQDRIEVEQAVALAKLVAQKALKIRQVQLSYILETITECARHFLGADSATINFLRDSHQNDTTYQRYIYQVSKGKFTPLLLKKIPPRKNGLGAKAIRDKQTRFIPDLSQDEDVDALKEFNESAWDIGIRAIAAFPLLVENEPGLLYVMFNREHTFTSEELRWGEIFAKRAIDAIRDARTHNRMRDKNRQLGILNSVIQSLVHTLAGEKLLRRIAGNALNILAADVVTIYEYIQTEKKFLLPPEIAGRLKSEQKRHAEIDEETVLFKLIEYGYYPLYPMPESIFQDYSFAKREKIKSAVGILLRVEEEIVGIMFINYRRFHDFTSDEKQIIETLASSAAIAIKNQRWLTTLSDIENEIVTTLNQEKLLSLIVHRAVQITGADVGDILRLDYDKKEIIIETGYPPEFEVLDEQWSRLEIGEGITGLVAKDRKAIIVDDVNNDSHYKDYYKGYYCNIQSELCVPLLDQKNVLGVLNVESRTKNAFTQRDLARLKILANQAVIAIQNMENKKQLVAAEKLAKQLLNTTKSEKMSSQEVGNLLKKEGVSELFSKDAFQQTELIANVQVMLQQLNQFEMMLASLRQTNRVSLRDVPEDRRNLICEQFRKNYDFLNLVFHSDRAKLEVNDLARMNILKESWEKAVDNITQNDTRSFTQNISKLTNLLCSKLGFSIKGKINTQGQFYGRMLDAYNPAFKLNIRNLFPIIYACKKDFSIQDIGQINGLLHEFKIYTDSFALVIAFYNDQQLTRQIRESAYKNDYIVINHDQFWDILAAKSPIQRLKDYILEQIDLATVSPYVVNGPVNNNMFFGRAEEEKTLLNNIPRNSYAVLANRKMGKTSLLNKIVYLLRQSSKDLVFFSDLQRAANYGTFYEIFYEELFKVCPDLKSKITKSNDYLPSNFHNIILRVKEHKTQNIIIIFDEVDSLLSYDMRKYGEQLFKTFRSLSQRENVSFLFSGTTTIVKQLVAPNSAMFNFCESVKLHLLSEKAAKDLITIPMENIGIKFKNREAIVQNIISITARHPNIIQYICDRLIKEINKQQKRIIEEKDIKSIFNLNEFYEYFENLIWGQSTDKEKLIIYLMWSYSEFTEADVRDKFLQKGLSTENVKESLETLKIYSTLSKRKNKYFFTFQEFGKIMEKFSDIEELTRIHQRKIGGPER